MSFPVFRHSRRSAAALGTVAFLGAVLGFGVGLGASFADAADFIPHDSAVLRGLDKVSARVSTIETPVGVVVRFGALEVVAESCRKPPEEERREAAAFLIIREIRPDEPVVELFRGWMFASSPALSAMDHAVYDIWVLDCVNTSSTAESTMAAGKSE